MQITHALRQLFTVKAKPRLLFRAGIVLALVLTISFLHFVTGTEHIYLHQIYQRSYYLPIVLASFWFELWGGLATAAGLAIVYVVHIMRDWAHYPVYSFEQYTEIFMYLAVAALAGYMSLRQRKARERLEVTAGELSAAYKKLNETFEQLRHSDRLAALGQLSAGIAHEIRNPLGSVQGAVEILSQGLRPEDPKTEFAEIAKREVARLDKLVAEILQFSRPASPQPVPCDLGEVIEAACRLCTDRAQRQRVRIDLKLDSAIPPVLVDPGQIQQVVLNILLNALQVQPNGGEVRVQASEASGEALISICDSGPGIDAADLDRIFDPFFTTRKEGTGLGLSISYQLVRNNGGRIRAISSPGQGTCFSISFPMATKGNLR